MSDAGPRISVVVPTFRRPVLLARCLDALLRQRFDPAAFEIIVVDDGCSRSTQIAVDALFERHGMRPAIRYVRNEPVHGPAAARNRGWRLAAADVIAFTDDDTIPDSDWLAEGERSLAPEVAAVAGRVSVPLAGGQGARPTDHELMTLGLEAAEFVTANAFVRRSALEAVGGFDERFVRAWREDSDLQFKLLEKGARIGRAADAVVLHPVRPEPWGVSLRQQKNVFYDALLFKKHPRLYRERILAGPPWSYYGVVALSLGSFLLWIVDIPGSAMVSALLALAVIFSLTVRRLRRTARTPEHVLEMLATSALIPFLSVYWRLRGAWHFRVAYF